MRPKITIFAVAEKAFTPQNQMAYSGYMKDVAHQLGVWLPDVKANQLVEAMQNDHSCIQLGNDDVRASEMAAQHYLVIAGTINPHGDGHVVIIVPGRAGKFAKGYWGSIGGAAEARENYGIDYAWLPQDRGHVEFFATIVPSLIGQ